MAVIRCFRCLLLIVLLTGVTADLVTDSSSDGISVDDDFKQQQQQQLSMSDLVRICTERLKYDPTLKRAEATTSKLSLRSLISCYFLTVATGSRNAAATVGDDGLMSDSALYAGDDTGIDAEQKQEQKYAIDEVSKRAPVPSIRHPSLTFASSPAAVGYPTYRHIGLRMDFGKRGAPPASAVRRERRQQAGHYGFRMDFGKRQAPPSLSWSSTPVRASRNHFGFRMDFGKRRAPSSPSAIARNFASSPSVRQHLGYRMDFGKRRVSSPSSSAIIGSMGRGLRSGVKVAIRQPQHFGFRTDFGKRSADEDMQQISEY